MCKKDFKYIYVYIRGLFGKSEFISFQIIKRRLKIQDWKTAIEDRQISTSNGR